MTIKALLQSFGAWSERGEPLVLASVYETEGSTYSKAGARMLIARDGVFQAMLSGGCLEGDLALRAEAVLESGRPQAVTYDLGGSDEALWGLGVGCDGLMRIFLQPLLPERQYQPFAAMAKLWSGDEPEMAATVIESAEPALEPGATLVGTGPAGTACGIPAGWRERFAQAMEDAQACGGSLTRTLEPGGRAVKVLFARLLPPPRVLVLGAGLDAEPLVRFADALGWRVTVQDHRPAYIAKGDFGVAERILCEPAERVADALELDRYEAVIVMSHHLDTDRKYLAQVAGSRIPYVGLLGPPNRRRRLLSELGAQGQALEQRLHGPAGFDIGADGPAPIALSIVAEILAARQGRA